MLGLFHLGEVATVEDTRFDIASFWVQIRCMTRENIEAIGSTLGKVECVEESAKGDCHGRCMRVQININIMQPLCRGRLVNMGGPKPQWISSKYERMLTFCYWCGIMNHNEKDCKLWVSSLGTLQKKEQQYGAWIRATIEWFQVHHVVKNDEDYNRETSDSLYV